MQALIEKAKELLINKEVLFIIGYAKDGSRTRPFIARKPEDAEKLVFNHYCINNLAVYLTRIDIPMNGKVGIVAKGCDIRSIVALIQEKQIKRENVYIIGMNCNGVVKDFIYDWNKDSVATKCLRCMVRTPHVADVILGELEEFEKPEDNHLKKLQMLQEMSPEERWNFWEKEFEKCIKCYACRQVCPLCYCEQCIVDKTTPRWIESSASIRGNFAWNIIRAFHLAGRCIGCGECDRACPMDIPLSLLNRKMGMVAFKEFNYSHGMDINEPTLIGSYKMTDKNDFIK